MILVQTLKYNLNTNDYADVTLAADDDNRFEAHKNV